MLYVATKVDINAIQQCNIKITQIEVLQKDKMFSFLLSMEAQDSSLLRIPLAAFSCSLLPVGQGHHPVHTTVTTSSTHPGVYKILCNPATSGAHIVRLLVHDVLLENASIAIPFHPCFDHSPPVRIITGLTPWRIAIGHHGYVVVTETLKNIVTILDNEGKIVKSIGWNNASVNFRSPRGVAVTPDNFILAIDNNMLYKLTMDGDCVASVGGAGSGPLQFLLPGGIAISETGHIYIADYGNHRIQVLNPDLTFSHAFGSIGSDKGQFQITRDVAIDSAGLLYVADYGNDRIQKFTLDGTFVAQFGKKGSSSDQLSGPIGIAIDNADFVYVTEFRNHCISVFTSNGDFVSTFGERGVNVNQFCKPTGIRFNKDGSLYVCDYGNNRLVIY